MGKHLTMRFFQITFDRMFLKIYRILSSRRLAVFSIGFLVVLLALVTFIPQHAADDFYRQHFPGAAGDMVVGLELGDFTQSPVFLFTAAIFTLNLLACGIRVFLRHCARPSFLGFAADFIHMGVLLLIVSGLLTSTFGFRRLVTLHPGERMFLENAGLRVWLSDTREHLSTAGVITGWSSDFFIGDTPGNEHTTSVNRPAYAGGFIFHQHSWQADVPTVHLDVDGRNYRLFVNEGFVSRDGGTSIQFRGIETDNGGAARFEVSGPDGRRSFSVAAGEPVLSDNVVAASTGVFDYSTILVRKDPGFVTLVPGLLLLVFGVLLGGLRQYLSYIKNQGNDT